MALKFGACVSWEHSAILKDAGADFIELPLAKVAQLEEKNFEELPQILTLPAEVFNIFLIPNLKIIGDDVAREAVENYLKLALPRAKRLGGEVIVFGSGGARRAPENWNKSKIKSQLLDFLSIASDIAEREGLIIAIEPLNSAETNTINKLEEALELADRVGKDNIGVILDIYHFLKENERYEVLEIAKDKLVHIHISDKDRNPPLKQDENILAFLRILKAIRYEGRISIESKWENLDKELPLAMDNLRKMWRCS